MRISLRTLLIGVGLAAAVLALYLRDWRDSLFEYANGFRIGRYASVAMVERDWQGKRRTLFLLCFADGPGNFGAATAWPRNPMETGCHPRGLFVDGQRLPQSTAGHIWVCDNSSGESVLMRVDLGEHEGAEIPSDNFSKLATTPLWKERVEPLLDFFTLRNELACDVFGRGFISGIPPEYHGDLLGAGYGDELGAVIGIEDLPSPEELRSRFQAIEKKMAEDSSESP